MISGLVWRAAGVLAVFVAISRVASASNPIVVEGQGAKYNIFVAGLAGANGGAGTAVLQNDLKLSGDFVLTSADSAQFSVKGSYSGGSLSGSVSTGSREILNRTFSGSWRSATHQFADAIVEAVTGKPGIAGTRVVFVSAHSGAKELYLMDLDGANLRQLTKDGSLSLGPKFNSAGNLIAYTSYKSGYPDVWVIDLGASNRRRVSSYPGLNSGPCFSPDGTRIALTLSKDGNTELYTIAAEGGSAQRLTHTAGAEASPTYSPDGSQIAYVSDDRGSAQIYIMPSSGGACQRFNTSSSYATEPDWSPDGNWLAYSVQTAGQNQIAISEIRSGRQTVLTQSGVNETPTWCRNSRHLIFARGGKLYLLDSKTKQIVQLDNGLARCTEPNASR